MQTEVIESNRKVLSFSWRPEYDPSVDPQECQIIARPFAAVLFILCEICLDLSWRIMSHWLFKAAPEVINIRFYAAQYPKFSSAKNPGDNVCESRQHVAGSGRIST